MIIPSIWKNKKCSKPPLLQSTFAVYASSKPPSRFWNLAKKWPKTLQASLRDEPVPEMMWWKNELLLVLWQLSMSGFSLKLFVCCSIPVMMFVISYMHDYACYVSCILVHNLYQLIQTNLTWAAQCWTILGQTWFIAQDINTDIMTSWHHDITWMTSHAWWLKAVLHWWLCTCTADWGLASSGACETVNQCT